MKTRFACIAVLAWSLSASGEERQIRQAEVPEPVIATIKTKYPAAKLLRFERDDDGGKLTYEVKIADGARSLEVACTADGKIATEEETIAFEAVPVDVKNALRGMGRYRGWTVRRAERVIVDEKAEAPSYEIEVTENGARAEIVFTADGAVTKTEDSRAPKKAHSTPR